MATRIDSVESRARLKPRHEPYWARVSAGCQIGFRKVSAHSTGAWTAKYRGPDGARVVRSLGEFEELAPSQRFDAARRAAEEWFTHLGKGGTTEAVTVRTACDRYVEHLRATKPASPVSAYALKRRTDLPAGASHTVRAADDAQARFKNYVLDNAKFADTELSKLTPAMLDAWRRRLRERPTRSGGNRGEERTTSSLNRDMTCFRAALNLAFVDGLVTSDFAWRGKLRPIKDADRRRELYLDKDQRRRLIEKAPADLGAFLKGMALLPLRPGALAALSTSSFDKRLGVLLVGQDKSGRDRKLKLPPVTAEFFVELARNKLPGAPLFARADGRAWDKDAWKYPVRAAVEAAELPAGTTAYTLRHSTISDLVHDGLDLISVAQISGTSVRMIEKHYGHLRSDVAADALAKLAL
ncbi:MAG: tyrosine-type recombinase/integrase [Burkholderiales bacterium]|nr:tyrosine-type recombinase/integrase [Burkholderiales bacterium]MDE2452046.1 tyrosine-type recombinase/integrase [Burkholderiales bacterium]